MSRVCRIVAKLKLLKPKRYIFILRVLCHSHLKPIGSCVKRVGLLAQARRPRMPTATRYNSTRNCMTCKVSTMNRSKCRPF